MFSSSDGSALYDGTQHACSLFFDWLDVALDEHRGDDGYRNVRGGCLCDAHCHLDLMRNGMDVAHQSAQENLTVLNMGIEPEVFPISWERYGSIPTVLTGIGLHPWYVDESRYRQQLDCFDEHAGATCLVGEIGLDFSPAHAATAVAQREVFRHILHACAQRSGLLLSVHAVRSAHIVLDEIEQSGLARDNLCAFHWFSGSSDDLQRALRIGALFSINPRMLETRRGREYARIIPADRMLFETDAPARTGTECSAASIAASLRSTMADVAALKNDR